MSRITDCGLSVMLMPRKACQSLQRIDGRIVLIVAISIGASKNYHVTSSGFDLLHPGRHIASPAWPGDQIVRGVTASGAGSRRIEIRFNGWGTRIRT